VIKHHGGKINAKANEDHPMKNSTWSSSTRKWMEWKARHWKKQIALVQGETFKAFSGQSQSCKHDWLVSDFFLSF